MFAPPKFSRQCEKSAKAYSEYLTALVYYNGCIARVSGNGATAGVPSSGLPDGGVGCAGRLNGRGDGSGGRGAVAVGRLLEAGDDRVSDVGVERGRTGAVARESIDEPDQFFDATSISGEGLVEEEGRASERGESTVPVPGRNSERAVDALEPVRGPRGGVSVGRGPNYAKRQAEREKRRARAARAFAALREREANSGAVRKNVEPAGLHSVRAAHPQLDETWAERKIVENRVATAQLRAKLEKMEKERADGTAEKRYRVEANLVQGQLDGAFALVPQQRVVSWAKTINSDSTGSKSSGKKTVASIPSVSSGLGSSSATLVSANEKRLAEENAKLHKRLSAANSQCKVIQAKADEERREFIEMMRARYGIDTYDIDFNNKVFY